MKKYLFYRYNIIAVFILIRDTRYSQRGKFFLNFIKKHFIENSTFKDYLLRYFFFSILNHIKMVGIYNRIQFNIVNILKTRHRDERYGHIIRFIFLTFAQY